MTNRTVCEMLREMRKCCETNNFSYLAGLIEEVQCAANRMESALYDKGDLDRARKEASDLRKESKKLEEEIKAQKKAVKDQPLIIQETNKLKNTLKEMKKDLKNVYKMKEKQSER